MFYRHGGFVKLNRWWCLFSPHIIHSIVQDLQLPCDFESRESFMGTIMLITPNSAFNSISTFCRPSQAEQEAVLALG